MKWGRSPIVVAFGALLLLASLLIVWRVEQALVELVQRRAGRIALALAADIERGHALGLGVAEQVRLPELLARQRVQERLLEGVSVSDERLRPVASLGQLPDPGEGVKQQLLEDAGKGLHELARHSDRRMLAGAAALDATGRPSALVWVRLDMRPLRSASLGMFWPLGLTSLALTLAAAAAVRWWPQGRGAGGGGGGGGPGAGTPWGAGARRAGAALLLLLALGLLVGVAREAARPLIVDEAERGSRLAALSVAEQLRNAMAAGVPLDRVVGLDAALRVQLDRRPELQSISARDGAGRIVSLAAAADAGNGGSPAVDLVTEPGPAGWRIEVGLPRSLADRLLASALVDMLLAVVIAGVLVHELSLPLWRRLMAGSLGGSASPVAPSGLRLIVFLVALSDEMLRPFLVAHAVELRPIDAAWPPSWLAAAPVAAFMTTLTLAQPLGAAMARRWPIGRSLIGGTACGAVVLLACAVTNDGLVFMALRAGSGMVYGLLLLLVQAALVRGSTPLTRASSLAQVPAAIVAAGISGPLLGGMAADLSGAAGAFIACAVCLAAACGLASRVPPLPAALAQGPSLRAGLAAAFRHPQMAAVTWLTAVPARLAAGALLALLVPLAVAEAGAAPSTAGRVLALYFLVFLLAAPWAARQSDASGRRKPWLFGGALVSGLACAVPWLAAMLPAGLVGPEAALALACAALGLGQAMFSAPQLALVTEAAARETHGAADAEQALAAFRFIERFGSIAAPLAAGAAVTLIGIQGTAAAVGGVVLAGVMLLAVALSGYREGPLAAGPNTGDGHAS